MWAFNSLWHVPVFTWLCLRFYQMSGASVLLHRVLLPSPPFPSSLLPSLPLPSPTLPLALLPPSSSSPSGPACTWWSQARLGSKRECSKWHAEAAIFLRLSLRSHPVSLPLHLAGHKASTNSRKGEIDFISLWPPSDKRFMVILNAPHKACHIQA